jgi:hypothetical protein
MKKFVLVLALVFAFTLTAGKAFAGSIALTGTMPAGGYPQATNPAPAHVSNNIRMAQAQSISLTGQLPSVSAAGAGATAAIPSINMTGQLPDGAQGLTANAGNISAGVAVLEGLGYLFTVKLLTLHF